METNRPREPHTPAKFILKLARALSLSLFPFVVSIHTNEWIACSEAFSSRYIHIRISFSSSCCFSQGFLQPELLFAALIFPLSVSLSTLHFCICAALVTHSFPLTKQATLHFTPPHFPVLSFFRITCALYKLKV